MGLTQSSKDPVVEKVAQGVFNNLQNTPKSRLGHTLMTILRFLRLKSNRKVVSQVIRASQSPEAMLAMAAVYKWRLITKIIKIMVGVSVISASGVGIYLNRKDISDFFQSIWSIVRGECKIREEGDSSDVRKLGQGSEILTDSTSNPTMAKLPSSQPGQSTGDESEIKFTDEDSDCDDGMIKRFITSVGEFFKSIYAYIKSVLKSIGNMFKQKEMKDLPTVIQNYLEDHKKGATYDNVMKAANNIISTENRYYNETLQPGLKYLEDEYSNATEEKEKEGISQSICEKINEAIRILKSIHDAYNTKIRAINEYETHEHTGLLVDSIQFINEEIDGLQQKLEKYKCVSEISEGS